MLNEGKLFEEQFKKSVQQEGYFIHRLRDSDSKVYHRENPCDFLLFTGKKLAGIECKSTKKGYMTIETVEDSNPKAMIKFHQWNSLLDMTKYENIKGYIVFEFRDEDNRKVYAMDIIDFVDFLQETHKKSINETDCKIRSRIIKAEKVRVRYKYNVKDWIEDI